MTWRGILRDVERTAKRNARENERKAKQKAKEASSKSSDEILEQYSDILEKATSLHKHCCDAIDWNNKINQYPQETVDITNYFEKKALEKKVKYKPSILDKLSHSEDKQFKKLDINIINAKNKDEDLYKNELKAYEIKLIAWKKNKEFSQSLLNKDPDSIKEVISSKLTLKNNEYIGKSIKVEINKGEIIVSELEVNSIDEIIPSFNLEKLKSGVLSKKDMPSVKRYGFYNDYISSAVLRLARELYAILPINDLIVNAIGKVLNEKNGHIEDSILLSAYIPKETLATLNFDLVDPSLCIENFKHNVNFKKTIGFIPVEHVVV